MRGGILPLNEATISMLKQKHPEAADAEPDIMFQDLPEIIHPVRYDIIDCEMIKKATLRTRGGAGPSGLDGEGWLHILTSKRFGNSSTDLCKCIAQVTKKMCSEEVSNIDSLLACRLIPLDKNPGLRPIGVGEILRRIIGKTVMIALKGDITRNVGSLQTCAGQDAGIEATIHAMRELFESAENEAVLLVDASNAFNSVNRKVFLHNIQIICPSISTFVQNCYSKSARLFVIGGTELKSSEGTTQGDPIAMAVYAIATIPLILTLVGIAEKECWSTKNVGYADDLAAAGTVDNLKLWWDKLCELGPKFGYHPQDSKSFVVVKSKKLYHKAEIIFKNTNIQITDSGRKYLGSMIGSKEFKTSMVNDKVQDLCNQLSLLSDIAKYEPQVVYTAFTTAFKHKVNHLMRTIPNISSQLKALDNIIDNRFIPAITNSSLCSPQLRSLLTLPPKLGGLGIPQFSKISNQEYDNSCLISMSLKDAVKNQNIPYQENDSTVKRQRMKQEKRRQQEDTLKMLRSQMNENEIKLNDLATQNHSSIWLTTLPIKNEGYCITKQQFWDMLAIRYGWELKKVPMNCECGASFDIDHAFSCKKGGFVSLRHNMLRNSTYHLLKDVCKDVRLEPPLQVMTGENLSTGTNTSHEARLDIVARGFWQSYQLAFYDIRVFNPLAKRYNSMPIAKCYKVNEKEKKKSYNQRVMEIEHGSFTPLVFSATGGMGRECEKFFNRIAEMIAEKRDCRYSVIVTWIRRKIIFSLINSMTMCIRGSRTCSPAIDVVTDSCAHTSEMNAGILF